MAHEVRRQEQTGKATAEKGILRTFIMNIRVKSFPFNRLLYLFNVYANQRVATTQMVIEKRKRCTEGEAIKPQGNLGQLHGHRIEVHAISTSLEHVAFHQSDVR